MPFISHFAARQMTHVIGGAVCDLSGVILIREDLGLVQCRRDYDKIFL